MIPDDIKGLIIELMGKQEDKRTWIQVGKLDQADIGLRRSKEAMAEEFAMEAEVLNKKLDLLKARADADGKEWWAHLKKKYGLRAKGDFRIVSGETIMMAVEDERNKVNE